MSRRIQCRNRQWLPLQAAHEKIHGGRTREERNVIHRTIRRIGHVASPSETADLITGDHRCSASVHVPAAFAGNDQIVGRLKNEIDANVQHALQQTAVWLEVCCQR